MNENLRRWLDQQLAEHPEKIGKKPRQLPPLDVGDEMTVFEVETSDQFKQLMTGLNRGERQAISLLLRNVVRRFTYEGVSEDIRVGDLREMTDDELRLLGGGVSRQHPNKSGVDKIRALFGRKL